MDECKPDEATGPCRGLRVVDFSTVVSGPLCTQILGDLGADVVKVETPGGDFTRHTPPAREGMSAFFSQFNRNKRSIVVDLKAEEGRELAGRLIEGADVVVENFRPGVADRIGIGYEAARTRNPRLIYVSINGFGPDGPYSEQPAYDLVIQGLVGMMPIQAGDDAPPALLKSLVADKCAAMTASTAVMAALLERERSSGRGQKIDIPMLDAFAAYVLPDMMVADAFELSPEEMPPTIDIYRTWETADGHVVGLVIQDSQFQGLCRALEREELLENPEYATFIGRITHMQELYSMIESELRKRTTAEFVERARKFGVPFAPVNTLQDFLADPQVQHNRTHFQADDSQGVRTRYLRHPARYSETPANFRRHAPRLGEHTDELLAEAGYDAGAIDKLRSASVVS